MSTNLPPNKYVYDERRLHDLLDQIETLKAENEKLRQRSRKVSPLSDPDYRAKCLDLRSKYEKLAIKDEVTLAHIFTVSNKPPKIYRNPTTGQTWESRGKMPEWLKGHIEEYLIKANGK